MPGSARRGRWPRGECATPGPGASPPGRSAARPRTTSTSISRSTTLIRSCRVSSVSPGSTRTARWSMIGPVSTPASTQWQVHPVTLTPCASASRTPWAPGKLGSRAGWVLIDPVRPEHRRAEHLHEPGGHDEVGCVRGDEALEGEVPVGARHVVGHPGDEGRDAGPLGALDAAGAVAVGTDREHPDAGAGLRRGVDQGLQVAARTGHEDDEPERLGAVGTVVWHAGRRAASAAQPPGVRSTTTRAPMPSSTSRARESRPVGAPTAESRNCPAEPPATRSRTPRVSATMRQAASATASLVRSRREPGDPASDRRADEAPTATTTSTESAGPTGGRRAAAGRQDRHEGQQPALGARPGDRAALDDGEPRARP